LKKWLSIRGDGQATSLIFTFTGLLFTVVNARLIFNAASLNGIGEPETITFADGPGKLKSG
jgi:hypothetical protein